MTRQEEYFALKAENGEKDAIIEIAERDIKAKYPNGFTSERHKEEVCEDFMDLTIREFKPEMLTQYDNLLINQRIKSRQSR